MMKRERVDRSMVIQHGMGDIHSLRNKFNELIRLIVSAVYQRMFKSEGKMFIDSRKLFSKLNWKNIILLDACRYDVFKFVVEKMHMFSQHSIRFLVSNASSTPEFIREVILSNRDILRDVIYISANPMIDIALKSLNRDPNEMFHKYIPAWKIAWNERYKTVLPEDLYILTLRTFIKYPSRRMIIHFLQPHFPYISKHYEHINRLLYNDIEHILRLSSRETMNMYDDTLTVLMRLLKIFLSCGVVTSILSTKYCKYVKQNNREIMRAYVANLVEVLHYVKKLTEILPGKSVITSDHGEALGEFIHPLIPIRLWGHISRIRISSLTLVPLIIVYNDIPLDQCLKKALREVVRHSLRKRDKVEKS